MKIMNIIRVFLTTLPLILVIGLAPSVANAHSGFVWSSSGKIIAKTGGGECLHTGRWKSDMGMCGKAAAKKGAKVKDSDGDGVMDPNDACPGTPYGINVDARGCEVIGKITIPGVHFDFDRAVLKDSAQSILDGAADTIKRNANVIKSVDVVGYTDSTGPAAYNQGLSERRANAVKSYLEGKGVSKVNATGAGESSPVGDNSTREGRKQNRRVEIDVKM